MTQDDNLPAIVRTPSNLGLSGLQIQTVELLLTEPKITDVAAKVGVTRQSIYNWLKDGKFAVYLAEREAQVLEEASRRMVTLVNTSTELLQAATRGEKLTSDQKFACDLITKRAPRLIETSVLYSRLAKLQHALEEINNL